ncbi:hypothetical protein KCP75_13435 [Salmonella enterica subsp. enterica]|nr:hypothetical protein KCP75_13435 [Salmonella enterica subsp. enterica]
MRLRRFGRLGRGVACHRTDVDGGNSGDSGRQGCAIAWWNGVPRLMRKTAFIASNCAVLI